MCLKYCSKRFLGADQLLVNCLFPESRSIVEPSARFSYSPFVIVGDLVKIGLTKELPDEVPTCSDSVREVP